MFRPRATHACLAAAGLSVLFAGCVANRASGESSGEAPADASDAAPDSVSRGRGSSDAAPPRGCQGVTATFCDDFDVVDAGLSKWPGFFATDGGTVAIGTNAAASPPFHLESRLADWGGYAFAATYFGGAPTVKYAADIRIVSRGSVPVETHEIYLYDPKWLIALELSPTGDRVVEEFYGAQGYDTDGMVLSRNLPDQVWTHVEVVAEPGLVPGRARVSIDGVEVARKRLVAQPGSARTRIGAGITSAFGQGPRAAIDVDNVVVTVE